MKKRFGSKWEMCNLVLNFLEKKSQIVKAIPGASGVLDRLKTRKKEAEGHWHNYHQGTGHTTHDKETSRLALVDKTIAYNTILTAFAVLSEKPEWAIRLKENPIRLKTKSAQDLVDIASWVHHQLADFTNQLAPWQISAAETDAFRKQIKAFDEKRKAPRNRIADRSAFRKQAEEQTDKIIQDLEIMDKLVACVSLSMPDFYQEYKALRRVRRPKTTTMSVLGKVLLADSDQPAFGATVTTSFGKKTFKVTRLGQLRIKNAAEGSHTLTITYPGLPATTFTIYIISATTTKQVFRLPSSSDRSAAA